MGCGHMLRASCQNSPVLVDRSNSPDEPAPWLRPHLQTAGTSRLLRAGPPTSVASVLSAFGFCLRTLPLATGATRQPSSTPAISTLSILPSQREQQNQPTPPLGRP